MNTATESFAPLTAGDQIHALHTGVMMPRKRLAPDDFPGAMAARPYESVRGATITLTADFLDANPGFKKRSTTLTSSSDVGASSGSDVGRGL